MSRLDFPDAKILIIDDEQERITLLNELLALGGFHNTKGLADSRHAWKVFMDYRPDLVVLDLHMAHLNGFDILRHLDGLIDQRDYLPILVMTGDASRETREQALASGAMDFIAKPFNVSEILLRVKNLLHTRLLHLELQRERNQLEVRVQERTKDLEDAQQEILERLALAADYRDDDTGEHTRRVGDLAKALALELGIAEQEADRIGRAALLHDVGKIGVPDNLLLKPGKLTPEEFEVIKKHTDIGGGILSGSRFRLLQVAEEIARTHHEKWDGSGYMGLQGEEIPLAGRIVAVADVFDALISERPYKEAWPREKAIGEILAGAGKHFDPRVVEAFTKIVGAPAEVAAA
jgi:putative two-component system response regulator